MVKATYGAKGPSRDQTGVWRRNRPRWSPGLPEHLGWSAQLSPCRSTEPRRPAGPEWRAELAETGRLAGDPPGTEGLGGPRGPEVHADGRPRHPYSDGGSALAARLPRRNRLRGDAGGDKNSWLRRPRQRSASIPQAPAAAAAPRPRARRCGRATTATGPLRRTALAAASRGGRLRVRSSPDPGEGGSHCLPEQLSKLAASHGSKPVAVVSRSCGCEESPGVLPRGTRTPIFFLTRGCSPLRQQRRVTA